MVARGLILNDPARPQLPRNRNLLSRFGQCKVVIVGQFDADALRAQCAVESYESALIGRFAENRRYCIPSGSAGTVLNLEALWPDRQMRGIADG